MNHPIVSIVMPAYNAAQFLHQAIQSVLHQTFTNFELLILDDGSTDRSLQVANQVASGDRRIHSFSHPNRGVSATRNRGIKLARGSLIAFLDADDIWLPDKLAAHVEHFQVNPNLAVSFSRVECLSLAGEPTGQVSTSRLCDLKPEDFLYENPTSTMSNPVARAEVFAQLGGFAEDMSYSEDLEWLLRVICYQRPGLPPWQIEGIDRILVYYRASPAGLSASLTRMDTGWDVLIDRAREYAPDLVRQHYGLARAVHLRYLARRALRLRLPPKVGLGFMHRAIASDWRIFLKEPRRTFLTLLATYGRWLLAIVETTRD